MASEELGHWTFYLNARKEEINNLDQLKEEQEADIDFQ